MAALALMLAQGLWALPALAGNITDTGPGSFTDINNSGSQDYILVTGGASIGNVTNASGGTTSSGFSLSSSCCDSAYTTSLGVNNSTVTGDVTNSGTLTQTSGAASIAGIFVAGSSTVGGDITNDGQIHLSVLQSSYDANGILIDTAATVSGNVSNTGTITISGGGLGHWEDEVLENGGTISGNMVNSGTITVTAFGWAGGVENDGTITGNMTNNGTITATVTDVGGYAVALNNYSNSASPTGSLINNGTITATASGDSGYAYGIVSWHGTVSGSLINTGTITATSGSSSSTFGIQNLDTVTGSLTNSGTITATAGASGTAYGIENDSGATATGGISNSGTITATAGTGGTAYAIYNAGNALTVDQTAGTMTGDIGLSGNRDTLNISGGTVTGGVAGDVGGGNSNNADAVDLTGGTLVLPDDDPNTGSPATVKHLASYTQGSEGTLEMQVTPTAAPSVSASSITLGGTLDVAPQGSNYTVGHAYTYTDVISAGSSLSGSFASVTAPALFNVSLTPDGSKAESLSVTEVASPTSSAAVNTLIASLLGNSSNTGAAATLASALEGLNAPQLASATTQLTGPSMAQNVQAVRTVSSALSGAVGQRLLKGEGYSDSGLMSAGMTGGQFHLSPGSGAAGGHAPGGDPWIMGFGSFASGAPEGGNAGFHQDRGGLIAGADKYLNAEWTLGVAVQYAYTTMHFDDGSARSTADSYNGILYAGWHRKRLYVNSTAGFGWNVYNSSRAVTVGSFTANPTGSFDGWDASASVETGYAIRTGQKLGLAPDKLTLTPYLGLAYTRTHTNGFTESGDGVSNLSFQASDGNSLVSTLGLRAATRLTIPDAGDFVPEIHLAWERENLDESQGVNAAFVSSPGSTFSITGAQYGRDSIVPGFSLTQALSEDVHAVVTYDAKLDGGYTEQTVSAGLKVEF